MRTRGYFAIKIVKIGLLSIGVFFTSCNTLKRVGENELLLTKNNIFADQEKVKDQGIESLIVQEPNSTVLGFPMRLNIYNLAKVNPDSSYREWLHRKEKREKRLSNLLSTKQVNRLGESFLVKGYSEWFKKIGEAPVIIDTSRVRRSTNRLSAYYDSKGYFNNRAYYEIVTGKKAKQADVDYYIELGKPYIVDSISSDISSVVIDSIYKRHQKTSFINAQKQFNLTDFNNERSRLTNLFRNSGVYNFQESSITYNILRDTTPSNDDQHIQVELNIEDLRRRGDTSITTSPYNIYKFKKINIYPDHAFDINEDSLKTIEYNNYTIYYTDKLRYKPKALTDAIFIEKDSIYRELDRVRTLRQITNLNTFKYPNIVFVEDSTGSKLTSNIYLAARPKFSLGLDFDVTHSNIQRLGIGIGTSLVSRNIFRGAETLSLNARGTFGLLSDDSSTEQFFTEIGGDINISFPRFVFPFVNTRKIVPSYTLPRTRITIGTTFQKNIGLDKQTFNNILAYNWTPSIFKNHQVELLNVQYVRNVNRDRYFNVYQSSYNNLNDIAQDYTDEPSLEDFFEPTGDPLVPFALIIPDGTTGFTSAILTGSVSSTEDDFGDVRSIEERRIRLTENNLIFASNYTFNRNNKANINDNSFYNLRLKVESAGNLLAGISNIIPFEKNDVGDRLVFGVPFSQYIKTEVEYIKHWDLRRSKVLAFRSFAGIAIPYGNSNNIPFVRSYFGGGSNDNRAWFPYSLGPGRTDNVNDFNEANFKLSFNLEYRFPLAGSLKGAFFADAGNIWNVLDNVEDPDATFNGLSSLADIALGTGFGLRYDFNYFIFRVDTGFKTYNPAEEPSRRWFRDYNFANAVFQIGINYPF